MNINFRVCKTKICSLQFFIIPPTKAREDFEGPKTLPVTDKKKTYSSLTHFFPPKKPRATFRFRLFCFGFSSAINRTSWKPVAAACRILLYEGVLIFLKFFFFIQFMRESSTVVKSVRFAYRRECSCRISLWKTIFQKLLTPYTLFVRFRV